MVLPKQRKTDGLLQLAREVLTIEAEGISGLIQKLDHQFIRAVEVILKAKGRLIVTGIGKSGIVARKLVATFNSTGTPALFLHPVEAMHGDLGMVSAQDVVLALSNSGETNELTILLPSIERLGVPLIALTGRRHSTLAQHSAVVIDVGVPREACPLGLAPTASTTAALAMGDALAVALLTQRGFKSSDFRRFHPGGSLGARLSLAISEVMLSGDRLPLSRPGQSLREAIVEMDKKRLGSTLVVDDQQILQGIITDGDLRRALKKFSNLLDKKVQEIMTPSPQTISPEALASQALELMEHQAITVLPVVDQQLRVVGIIHLHDLLGRGEFKFTN
ncbi:MAG: KpsF/GutQ family sugar-phosphate isomerase [Deltaproteobacteria bacterium]|nr:KpsF/GutQ family sugar-phosphate isomerase [Deltaproteobacteria bacterium]MBW1951550.1 KpsF/GutQ family sugar-phosphate isomerase [Deltaproteobacteria bacterium]MBW1986796.1 KpsF/GutQ family sugar-phosphate isomerase [Deltaproteobacteria bacterium]MBW2135217.1 KpsF/GutQ family sugar-phosphate isomerase [Deltaproteobacteria bacterium]